MKEYDLIVIGTGSAMNLIDPILGRPPLYDTLGGSKVDFEIAEILRNRGGTR